MGGEIMRDEVKRICKLVADGKLSPEDAAEMIAAFEKQEAGTGTTPPPPPPGADPFKNLMDAVDRLAREGKDSVDWNEFSRNAKESAKKGINILRDGLDEIAKGKINLNWFSGQETREIALSFDPGIGKVLRVENACGGVKIVGGAATTGVVAKAKFKGATAEDAKLRAEGFVLVIEESDHLVFIRQADVSGLALELEISIAESMPVEVRVEAGDVRVLQTGSSGRVTSRSGIVELKGLNGLVEVSSDNSAISIEDCATPSLTIENKSGDMRLTRVIGNINARTANGNVRLASSHGKVIAVESVSGDVSADIDVPITGSVNIRTVSGDAVIGLCDGSDARVSLSTLRGVVTCSVELEDEAKADQRITGRLGSGSGALDVSAVTGNITVEIRDQAA
jgi:Putative adhesin